MPHHVLPGLIDSDNFSIENEVKFLGSSGLFSKFLIVDNQKNLIARYSNNDATIEYGKLSYIPIKDRAGITWGFFSYTPDFNNFIIPFVWLGLILFSIFAFIYILTRNKLNKYLNIEFEKFSDFLDKLEAFSKNIAELKALPEGFIHHKPDSEEYNKINRVINHLVDEIEKSHQKLRLATEDIEKRKAKDTFANIAAQVAHDIRSPLAALNAIVKQTQNIPEKPRIMIRNATKQINDIANNLLVQYRTEKSGESAVKQNTITPEMISILLDTVVSEKRAQEHSMLAHIEFNIAPDSHGVFAKVNPADFKRVISNLINNAIEALKSGGNIVLNLSHIGELIKIDLTDTGSGMLKELITKIMTGSAVSSKKEGHGIGLASSRQYIQSWGGDLSITSEINIGTTIHITLPLASPADWFADKLEFTRNSTVIILDDDQSIHDVWQSRIDSEIPNGNLNLHHFYQPEDLLATDIKADNYLCDYELIGHNLTGLDVIKQLNLAEKATLVTSRYEDPSIQERCQKIGVKILPKNYAAYVPLIIQEKKSPASEKMDYLKMKPDLILIDDNKTLTNAWKLTAEFSDKNIVVFNSISEAENEIHNYSLDSVVHIDSDLGENIKGEEYAKTLYEKGYKNLYLATGYEVSKFDLDKLYWIKKVVGKDPQFDDI